MDTNTVETPSWVYNRILSFFNNAQSVEEITSTIKDDPSDGPGRTISKNQAARILRQRQNQGFLGFTEFEQIDQIKGVGEGTIQDLIYTFNVTAAQAFQNKMYDENVIFRENWPLEFFRYEIEDKEAFENLVFKDDLLRQFVCDRIIELCKEKSVSDEDCNLMVEDINNAYMDHYNNSTAAAGYALALWFYEFDADNWFSWTQIQEVCASYFDYYSGTFNAEMELRFFKGFINRGIIPPGITPDDLYVVLNYPEQCVTIWFTALYD